jgi:adenine C2-methylase RlmN of 23S rRNA A2503 and tRNA A37
VNLIPYNPTAVGLLHGYRVPQDDAVQQFADVVAAHYGVRVKVRWSSAAGRGVDGACGQLVVNQPATVR